jgi:hypothetical protein
MAIDLVENTDHFSSAVGRLLQQYRDKPVFEKILRVISNQLQQVETMFLGIKAGYRLADAVGEQLNVLGRVVGQPRESAGDAEYRLRIAARIRANISIGAVEDLYTVFRLLLPVHQLQITPRYPAAFTMEAVQAIGEALLPLYRKFFADTKAAGVLGQFFYNPESDEDEAFTLDNALAPAPDSAKGFGNALAPGGGGTFAGVF